MTARSLDGDHEGVVSVHLADGAERRVKELAYVARGGGEKRPHTVADRPHPPLCEGVSRPLPIGLHASLIGAQAAGPIGHIAKRR
jgi:hypothetical protein